jgi:hypothetical protein
MYWPSAAPQANTAGLGPITRPLGKASRNNTISFCILEKLLQPDLQ